MTTVWTLPDCPQCEVTKKALTRKGIPFTTRDLSEHPDGVDRFKAAGHMSAPIVETEIGTWSGLRPDLIRKLSKQ